MDKFVKLTEYLRSTNKNEISLDFRQIEEIIGSKLPDSAYKYREYFSNNKTHPIANSWFNASYRVTEVDMNNNIVTFKKGISNKTLLLSTDQFDSYFNNDDLEDLDDYGDIAISPYTICAVILRNPKIKNDLIKFISDKGIKVLNIDNLVYEPKEFDKYVIKINDKFIGLYVNFINLIENELFFNTNGNLDFINVDYDVNNTILITKMNYFFDQDVTKRCLNSYINRRYLEQALLINATEGLSKPLSKLLEKQLNEDTNILHLELHFRTEIDELYNSVLNEYRKNGIFYLDPFRVVNAINEHIKKSYRNIEFLP